MKKIFILILALFASVFFITGCSSESKDKQLIIDTKAEIEKVSNQVMDSKKNMTNSFISSNYSSIAEFYEITFESMAYDMITNLEEKNNSGTKVYVKYNTGEENGMVTGEDKNDSSKYHIYIGSETYNDLWAYATIDLTTGEISWQDNY